MVYVLHMTMFLFAVILPPERAAECQSYKVSAENGEPLRRNAKNDVSEYSEKIINDWCEMYKMIDCRVQVRMLISFQDMECSVPVMDENHQEWLFTLYDFDNSGRVTKEVMAEL